MVERATALVSVGALITDDRDRILVVKPTYRDHWLFVGGGVDVGEPPQAAVEREIAEETGLRLDVGPLLVVDWVPLVPDWGLPMVHLLFDCGTVAADTPIALPAEELSEYRFATAAEATGLLSRRGAPRLAAAFRARSTGAAVYLPSAPASD